ncbi:MAG: PQQ-binding-like beta-propeller repeat protein [Patescibacteria group bacterium]|nr:PQQ-binding-like beta-propeller repeat protein [Patescibacteria group bacterium]
MVRICDARNMGWVGAVAILAAVLPLATVSAWAAEAWPVFRGPSYDGSSDAANLPLTWSEEHNVVWKTPISHRGWSTPVVMDGQIWLTTATEDGREMFVYCVDLATGGVLHRARLFQNAEPEPLENAVNSYASPTGALQPGRFFAHFGTYGTAAIDTETFEMVWQRRDLPCRHFRGPGSSVVLAEDRLILTMDGIDVQYVTALDAQTGRTVWTTPRSTKWQDIDAEGNVLRDGDYRKGYGTPILCQVNGQRQLASAGAMAAFGYKPDTGEELWTVAFNGYNAASSPVFAAGLVIVNTSNPKPTLIAVDPAGRGDVTETHVAWRYDRGVPVMPSPVVVNDELVIFVNNTGVAACLDAATGEELWKERIGGNYCASPLVAGGKVYFFDTQGESIVIAADREFRILARNRLDDGFMASPAVVGDRTMLLRTRTHLYRIEKSESRP